MIACPSQSVKDGAQFLQRDGLVTFLTSPAILPAAEEPVVEVNSQEALRQALESQTGKRMKVKVLSGQDLDGKVARVGTQALVLTELAGIKFFDATVRLDQVAAVIVRRGK